MIKHDPSIRFREFNDNYTKSKLESLFSERRERSNVGELISVTINDGVVKASNLARKDNSSKDKSNYKVVKVGDIAYNSMRMWQGASGVSPYSGILSPAYTVIYPKNSSLLDVNYFSRLFKTEKMINQFQINSQGLTSDTWNLKYPLLKEINVSFPSLSEQSAIGSLFQTLDELLSAYKDNLANFQAFKASMLSKMFPKAGQSTPEIRLDGFDGEWEELRLGEHSNIVTGGTPKTGNKTYWEPEEIPWMSSGEINKKVLNSTDVMISKIGLENSSAKWVKKHSVLIALAGQGKTRGTVAINNVALTTNQSIAAIEPDKDLNYKFLYANLDKRYEELRMISSGDGTRGGLNKKIISDISITIPRIEEQKAIGNFFAEVDKLILSYQEKINELEILKKKLLQDMFV